MDAQRWGVIDCLYHAALGMEPAERSPYLAAACADDPTLRGEVESLLAYADAEPSSPAQPSKMVKLLHEIGETTTSEVAELIGATAAGTAPPLTATIGRYRILGLLAEGGMG